MGLATVDDVRSYMITNEPWLAADPTLAPWPEPANQTVFQTGAWILADERPLPPEVERFLETGDSPIYFGFGSTRLPHDLSRAMVQSARALGRRALVSRGWSDLAALDQEADCMTIDEINLRVLFSRVAAVVYHGGAGTTTLAALAGAPQLVIPQRYDQHYWAQRVQQLGIGTAHAKGTPTAESMTVALQQTLQADVSTRAKSIAQLMRRDGALTAVQRLIQGPGLAG